MKRFVVYLCHLFDKMAPPIPPLSKPPEARIHYYHNSKPRRSLNESAHKLHR